MLNTVADFQNVEEPAQDIYHKKFLQLPQASGVPVKLGNGGKQYR